MSTENIYKKGTKVWIPHTEYVWHPATILEDYDEDQMHLVVQPENTNESKTLIIKSNNEMPPIYTENMLDDESNLNLLTSIHEASVLDTLRLRFEQNVMYNYCDLAMIVLNPFSELLIDESNKMLKYQGQMISKVEPHIFAYAEKVYCWLERENRDQSMVFTGESGAGKTTNAEYAIQYLVSVGAIKSDIKEKILASSIVLQAFGNAKTIKNDNSSRFGKFLQLQYDQNYRIIGAIVKAYFLDKSRIVKQTQHEQNFNIFYQLRSAKDRIPLLQMDYSYLNETSSSENDNINTLKSFNKTFEAMTALNFTIKQQADVLQISAIILHLGKLSFNKSKGIESSLPVESCFISDLNDLETLVKLSQLEENASNSLRKWMCYKRIFSQQDEFLQPMTAEQAIDARDALVKFIYSKMFSWIVLRINASFRSPCHVQSFIGILDLFGFEKIELNSLEQFCINYAEEKIQNVFLETFFKAKQEEYEREKIEWNCIEVQDNEACVKLIEGKFGIIDILDEETKTKSNISRSNESIYAKWERTKQFEKSEGHNLDFSIHHFVSKVEYSVDDFIEKNRDNLIVEQLEVLKDTKIDLLNKLLTDEYSKLAVSKEKRKSSKFKRQSLNVIKPIKKTLITEYRNFVMNSTLLLNSTTLHYVRCIKTNDEKESFNFNANRVVEQLRAYNVTETIRISAEGFANHQTYANFVQRYHCLLRFESIKRDDPKETCRKILAGYIEVVSPSKYKGCSHRRAKINKYDNNQVAYGKNKIFLRDEVIQLLERLRKEKRRRACVVIQKSVRAYLQQTRFDRVRRAVTCLQRNARLYLARRRTRQEQAAIKIQSQVRGWLARSRYQRYQLTAKALETCAKRHTAATDIQTAVRGYLVRRRVQKTIRDVIIVQSCARRFLAKVKAIRLRKERAVRMVQELRDNADVMKNKINITIEGHLASGQLEEVNAIANDYLNAQFKNKILSQMFLEKIQMLKELGARPVVKTCELPETECEKQNVHEENKNDDHNLCDIFKQIIREKDDCISLKSLFYSFYQFEKRTEALKEYLGLDEVEIQTLKTVIKDSDQGEANVEQTVEENVASSSEVVNLAAELNNENEKERRYMEKENRYMEKEEQNDENTEIIKVDVHKEHSETENEDECEEKEDIHNEKVKGGEESKEETYKMKEMEIEEEKEEDTRLSENRKLQENNYSGMFYIKFLEVNLLMRRLVELDPSIIIQHSPYLPAQILMMCIRYSDIDKDRLTADTIIHSYLWEAKENIKTRDDLFTTFLWMNVTHALLNYLKQFARDDNDERDEFSEVITELQEMQRLQYIDLDHKWTVLNANCQWMVNKALEQMRQRSAEFMVAGIVENEELDGSDAGLGLVLPGQEARGVYLTRLLKEFSSFDAAMKICKLDRKVARQLFKKIFNYMNSMVVPIIMGDKKFCTTWKGTQIRFNLMILEQWARKRGLTLAIEPLRESIQVARLLQIQPIDVFDINPICDHFDQLSNSQILKLLELYEPNEDNRAAYESAAERLKLKLESREEMDKTASVSSRSTDTDVEEYPVTFLFNYSPVCFEDVEVPAEFNLPMLTKI